MLMSNLMHATGNPFFASACLCHVPVNQLDLPSFKDIKTSGYMSACHPHKTFIDIDRVITLDSGPCGVVTLGCFRNLPKHL